MVLSSVGGFVFVRGALPLLSVDSSGVSGRELLKAARILGTAPNGMGAEYPIPSVELATGCEA